MRTGSNLDAGTGAACEQLSDRTGHPSTGKPSSAITAAVIAEIAESRAQAAGVPKLCNAYVGRHVARD
jgi:ribonucleotide monophosphatase NagD (HAD superfamily)